MNAGRYYVHAFGWWFCVARGWVHDPSLALPLRKRPAQTIKDEQLGVTVVEVSA